MALFSSCRGPPPSTDDTNVEAFPEFPDANRFYQFALDFEEDESWSEAADMLDSAIMVLGEGGIRRDSLGQRRVLFHQILLEEYSLVFEQLGSQMPISQSTDALPWQEDTLVIDSEVVEHIPVLIRDVDFSQFELKIDVNERVLEQIYYMAYRVSNFTAQSLGRLGRYDSLIDSLIKETNVPKELKYLALVESGYKSTATSTARAAGIWQFIPSTARHFGMDVSWWIDERRSPEKSTTAAFAYLNKLYAEFGDWYLAMAAYNCGEGRVRRQIKKQGTRNYWELDLPRETRYYVPRILATIIIASNPSKYGLSFEKDSVKSIDTVSVSHCMDLENISHAMSIDKSELRLLNPELRQQSTPPRSTYSLRLPQGRGEFFSKYYETIDKSKLICQEGHRVQRGENLSVIARKYRVSISAIKSANNMRNSRIWPNQILYIPLQGQKAQINSNGTKRSDVRSKNASSLKPKEDSQVKNSSNKKVSFYRVLPGDNLYSIGNRLGVSIEQLMDWNQLKPGSPLRIGQRLDIKNSSSEKVNPKVNPQGNKQVYRVQNGDNLYQISRKLGVSLNDLLMWNNLEGRAVIRSGDLLSYYVNNSQGVKKKNSANSNSEFYKVEKGDTLWGIAQKFGISVEEIIKMNQLKNNRIDFGQQLRIKE